MKKRFFYLELLSVKRNYFHDLFDTKLYSF